MSSSAAGWTTTHKQWAGHCTTRIHFITGASSSLLLYYAMLQYDHSATENKFYLMHQTKNSMRKWFIIIIIITWKGKVRPKINNAAAQFLHNWLYRCLIEGWSLTKTFFSQSYMRIAATAQHNKINQTFFFALLTFYLENVWRWWYMRVCMCHRKAMCVKKWGATMLMMEQPL